MRHLEIDAAMERRVVEALARPHSLSQVAAQTGLTFNQVSDVARRNGYPDVDALRSSLETLRRNALRPATSDNSTTDPSKRGARELRAVDVASITPDPDNVREHLSDIEDLAESMRVDGLIQPIVVRRRGNALIVVAGHRRLAAAKALGWDSIEAVITDDLRPADVLAQMIIENTQRRDLDPIEEARAYERLKTQLGCNTLELAKRLGRSQSSIDGRLALLALSPEDQDAVRAGDMGIGHGTEKARVRLGVTRDPGTGRIPHLSIQHALASRARARCRKQHPKGAVKVGKTACGECWEAVIRADEQRHALARSMTSGTCVTCEQPVAATAVDDAGEVVRSA